jgi:hypothetical protein
MEEIQKKLQAEAADKMLKLAGEIKRDIVNKIAGLLINVNCDIVRPRRYNIVLKKFLN